MTIIICIPLTNLVAGVDGNDFHVSIQNFARESNIHSRLLFITRQNPQVDTRTLQTRDRLRNPVLKLVLDTLLVKKIAGLKNSRPNF